MSGSLRRRAVVGGVLWAALVIAGGGLIVLRFVDAQAVRRFDAGLNDRLLQLTVAVERSQNNIDDIETLLTDPAYSRPYSGRYWQILAPTGELFTSRSLFDTTLAVASLEGSGELDGPDGQVRLLSRSVEFDAGQAWTLTVAETLAQLQADRDENRRWMLLAFTALTTLSAAMAGGFASYSLRPLGRLQRDVSARWEKGERMRPDDYPQEVAPLVTQLNDVLDRNMSIVDRARRQAADLAHALNTPSAILRNELDTLSKTDTNVKRAQDALDRIEAQITRSLARIRSSNQSERDVTGLRVSKSAARILRVIETIADRQQIHLSSRIDDTLQIRMDQQDFEEALGNIMENAIKWSRSTVRLTVARGGPGKVLVTVEDDGPGIADDKYAEALTEGHRLDTSVPGTGLGLAIVADLMAAYGGDVILGVSEDFGGLSASLSIPGGWA